MRHVLSCGVMAVLALTLAAGSGFAASTSPGTNAVFASLNAAPFPAPFTTLLTATLTKGKKGHVLAVEAMLTSGLYAPNIPMTLHINVQVNGIQMEPSINSPTGAIQDCGGIPPVPAGAAPVSCTVTGTWWLDPDAFPALIGSPSR